MLAHLRLRIHSISPNVQRLAVHLPNRQHVYFDGAASLSQVAADVQETTLTSDFASNATAAAAPEVPEPCPLALRYQDFPRQVAGLSKNRGIGNSASSDVAVAGIKFTEAAVRVESRVFPVVFASFQTLPLLSASAPSFSSLLFYRKY